MMTQADLDAAIAALPGQIEAAVQTATVTAVTNGVQPIITALQNAQGNGIDFTNEINSLNALAGTVAPAIASSVTSAVVTNLTPAQSSSASAAPASANTAS